MCQISPQYNYLGIDIRNKIIELANQNHLILSQSYGIKSFPNIHFLATNVNINLERILRDISKVSHVNMITIQFPDPFYKSKHYKRRVVTSKFIEILLSNTQNETKFFIQSDSLVEYREMVSQFSASSGSSSSLFIPSVGYDIHNPTENLNPFPIPTEREKIYLKRGDPIYRMVFERRHS